MTPARSVATRISHPLTARSNRLGPWLHIGGNGSSRVPATRCRPGRLGAAWETSEGDWQWILGVNLWGVIHGVRAFLPGSQVDLRPVKNLAAMVGQTSCQQNTSPFVMLKIWPRAAGASAPCAPHITYTTQAPWASGARLISFVARVPGGSGRRTWGPER